MIFYNHKDWWGTLLNGDNVLVNSFLIPTSIMLIWSTLSYVIANGYRVKFDVHGQAILGCFLTFLLIFRANQSYTRYVRGKLAVSGLSHASRDLISLVIFSLRGIDAESHKIYSKASAAGQEEHWQELQDRHHELRTKGVDAVMQISRLTVAYMVSVLAYTRVGFYYAVKSHMPKFTKDCLDIDRARLRGLLTEAEFTQLDKMLGEHVEITPLEQSTPSWDSSTYYWSCCPHSPTEEDFIMPLSDSNPGSAPGSARAFSARERACSSTLTSALSSQPGSLPMSLRASETASSSPRGRHARLQNPSKPAQLARDASSHYGAGSSRLKNLKVSLAKLLGKGPPTGYRIDKENLADKTKVHVDQYFSETGVDVSCEIDNQTNLPVVVAGFLRRELFSHCGKDHGYIERIIGVVDDRVEQLLKHYQDVNQIVTLPFPIGYSQLCKLLMIFFMAGCPFIIDTELGWFANVYFPTLIGAACFGIEHIAIDLELPFGEGANDLNVSESVHALECETLELLGTAGLNEEVGKYFCFLCSPEGYDQRGWYLCLSQYREASIEVRSTSKFYEISELTGEATEAVVTGPTSTLSRDRRDEALSAPAADEPSPPLLSPLPQATLPGDGAP